MIIFDKISSTDFQAGLVGIATFLVTKWLLMEKPKKNLPRGPKAYPIVGNAMALYRNNSVHLEFDTWADEFGDAYTISLGQYDVIVLSSKDAIRELFVDKGEQTSYRPILLIHSLMDATKGLLNNMGTPWKEQRRTAIAAMRDFGVGKLTLEQRILEEADSILSKLTEVGDEPLDLQVHFINATTNTICSIIFGERYHYDDREFVYLMKELKFIFAQGGIKNVALYFPQLIFLMPLMFPFIFLAIRRFMALQNFFLRKIQDHRESFDPENIRDFVDLYIEAEKAEEGKSSHNESQLFQTIFDLFVAGSETTSTTLRWCFLFLIRNPRVQEKCHEEIKNVIGESRRPTYADHSQMPYLDAVIEETLRLGNIAPATLIHTVNQDVRFRDYMIPKGTMLIGNTYTVHMDPENYENPEEFQPERWLGPDSKFKKNNSFLAFSAGPRECPGKSLAYQECFLLLTSLLQQFRFSAPDPENLPSIMGSLGITHSPVNYCVKAERI